MDSASPAGSVSGSQAGPDRGELLAIALGGAAGALARVGLSQAFPTTPGRWPWVTFAINLAGAFVLGLIVTWLDERKDVAGRAGRDQSEDLDEHTDRDERGTPATALRALLSTGLLGTFTTFSTVQLELLRMIDQQRYGLASAYVTASVLGGLVAVLLASTIVRRLRSER